jgi:signal transduction histidine kinase
VCARGLGIPPDARETIFERFERGAAMGGAGRFGLGLAIGRQLAARTHGELVIVDVEDCGGGECFELRPPPRQAGD